MSKCVFINVKIMILHMKRPLHGRYTRTLSQLSIYKRTRKSVKRVANTAATVSLPGIVLLLNSQRDFHNQPRVGNTVAA